jgi:large subunit ribosomal protein L10
MRSASHGAVAGAGEPQQYKVDAVAAIREAVEECPNLYFSDYRGLTVSQITELRGRLRDRGTRFTVVQNRYTRIALQDLGYAGTEPFLTGPTALALVPGGGDLSAVSKALLDFGRTTSLEVKGGYVEGRAIGPGEVTALSRLPGREQLLATLMGAMNAPIRNFVSVLQASVAQVARVLQAVAERKAEPSGAAASDTPTDNG